MTLTKGLLTLGGAVLLGGVGVALYKRSQKTKEDQIKAEEDQLAKVKKEADARVDEAAEETKKEVESLFKTYEDVLNKMKQKDKEYEDLMKENEKLDQEIKKKNEEFENMKKQFEIDNEKDYQRMMEVTLELMDVVAEKEGIKKEEMKQRFINNTKERHAAADKMIQDIIDKMAADFSK